MPNMWFNRFTEILKQQYIMYALFKLYLILSKYICLSIHHAFSVIHCSQILQKLFAHVELHIVVSESTEGPDDHMVPILDDFLVRLQ